MKSNFYVVIMAGGSGTRLWPKSRLKKPKQLYALINQESMIQNTVNRLLPAVPKENIFIATNREQKTEILKHLPGFSKNIIEEPFIRNTGPCIGLASVLLKDKNAPIAFLPADHYIGKEKEFLKVLKKAVEIAQKDYLVLIGIRPTDADTGLGYIKINLKSQISNLKSDYLAYQVEKFVEKPDKETAKKYLSSGQYLWNAGMFVARPLVILDLFQDLAPKIYRRLKAIQKQPQTLNQEYEKMENISFDYAIAEKAAAAGKKVAVVPGDFAWSDVGNWKKLFEMLSRKEKENIIIGCEHYGVETSGCLIHGTERLVATVGLKDIIVVDTPDVVLVCHKDKAQEVKKIVETLKNKGKEKYL